MGRQELAAIENGSFGEASGDMFFHLGMMYSTGAEVPTDYVSAHKWFNLAAMGGNADAARLRREIELKMPRRCVSILDSRPFNRYGCAV